MIRILMSCAGGFSSSLLMKRIQQAAQEKNIEVETTAIGAYGLKENIDNADIVLMAPQIRYMLKEFEQLCEEKKIPLLQISPKDYGRCNGENVLNELLEKLKEIK